MCFLGSLGSVLAAQVWVSGTPGRRAGHLQGRAAGGGTCPRGSCSWTDSCPFLSKVGTSIFQAGCDSVRVKLGELGSPSHCLLFCFCFFFKLDRDDGSQEDATGRGSRFDHREVSSEDLRSVQCGHRRRVAVLLLPRGPCTLRDGCRALVAPSL